MPGPHRKAGSLASAVALATAGVVALPAAGRAASHPTPQVPTASYGSPRADQLQRRPARIVYSGDGAALLAGGGRIANRIAWSTWNARGGVGRGANWLDNCRPDCARGRYSAYPADIAVSRPRRLAGYRLFTRMTVTYTSRRPSSRPYNGRSVTFRLVYDARHHTLFWSGR